MKSEHRHQLKTNELAEWIVNFPQWARKNAATIIYVSVIAVLVVVVYFWKVYARDVVSVRKQLAFTAAASQLSQGKAQILMAQAQGVDIGYNLLGIADKLQEVAQNTKDDEVAALALIKQAEALRTELHYRFGTVNRENLTEQLNRAKDIYTQALEKSSANTSLAAMAEFGLGLCEEELGNFDQAHQIYDEIVANPDYVYTVIVPQARQRLELMDDYKQPVVFKPAPVQAPAEVTQPLFDVNIPQLPEVELNLPAP